jgi:hypothetical protein
MEVLTVRYALVQRLSPTSTGRRRPFNQPNAELTSVSAGQSLCGAPHSDFLHRPLGGRGGFRGFEVLPIDKPFWRFYRMYG